jgi:hypothetical protein
MYPDVVSNGCQKGSLMIRRTIRSLAISLAVSAVFGQSSVLLAADNDACSLLTKADIQKETGLNVADATPGKPVPGVLGRCTWEGPRNSRVIVTLADAQHMGLTVKAEQETGGEDIKGLGSTAVGIKGAGFTGGGYIVSVLDAKGGFGVSILGKDGTRERAVALAKVVESHR